MTFWLGFIGNMDLLARVHRVDLLARFIGNMDLLASRLISYAFKGQMNDLCRKVKWSERPEPRASNIPGLGAWTRPPDRRWRITARGRGSRSACSRPGAGKTFNTGQSASKRGLTRGGKPSAPDHESPYLETGKTPPPPWSASVHRHEKYVAARGYGPQLATVQSRVSDLPA